MAEWFMDDPAKIFQEHPDQGTDGSCEYEPPSDGEEEEIINEKMDRFPMKKPQRGTEV